jgi:hypothetical protein
VYLFLHFRLANLYPHLQSLVQFRSFYNRTSAHHFGNSALGADLEYSTNNLHLIHVTRLTKMRLYKMAACIFPILSVFSFVLAAPVAVQGIREACADAVDGGKYAIIGSGKRAEVDVEEEDPLLAQAQQEPSLSSSSDLQSTPSQHQGSSSASNYASGTPPNPSFTSGE